MHSHERLLVTYFHRLHDGRNVARVCDSTQSQAEHAVDHGHDVSTF